MALAFCWNYTLVQERLGSYQWIAFLRSCGKSEDVESRDAESKPSYDVNEAMLGKISSTSTTSNRSCLIREPNHIGHIATSLDVVYTNHMPDFPFSKLGNVYIHVLPIVAMHLMSLLSCS